MKSILVAILLIFTLTSTAQCPSIKVIRDSGILNPVQFLAVISFESYNCTVLTERVLTSDAERYNGGARYIGRGIIQLTGKYNYKLIGRHLGIDLVNNPEMASDPITSNKIAIMFWKLKGLNKQGLSFAYICYRVNGKGYKSSYEARYKVLIKIRNRR